MIFTANTQDMANRMVAAGAMYGTLSVMVPDLSNTDYLLCMGSNPRVSKWTVFSVPNDSGRSMEEIKKRGATICFVNPRKTESSTPETGDTLLIKPGTDVYFLAALLNEIVRIDGLDQPVLERWAKDIDPALQFAATYPAERVSNVTGISPDEVRAVADAFCSAKGAGIYISVGVNQGRQGLLAAWLADLIVFATGNLGKKGGMYKPTGLADMHPPVRVGGIEVETSLGTLTYTAPGPAPLPMVALPELIAAGDIKALINLSGNPLMSAGGEEKLRAAIGKLDLLVSVDIQRNATAEMSDFVLPATDFLERADINMIAKGGQPVPYVQFTDAVVEPQFERRDDWRVLLDIAKQMGRYSGQESDGWMIINQILGADQLSVELLKTLPHQTKIYETTDPSDLYEKCLKHEHGKVDCYPTQFVERGLFERCERIFSELDSEPAGSLKMISMRTPHMHNTWLSNIQKFRRGTLSINPLHVSPEDAADLCLTEGDGVRVFNAYGAIETRVRIDNELRPGAVAMAHGYGRGRGAMRIAEANPGANANSLAPNTMDTVEPLSNMSWIGAYPVKVERL
jgi:formate dehydrogenase